MKRIISLLAILACVTYSVFGQWLQITSPSTNNLNSVYFVNSYTGFLSGSSSGTIIKTTDGGSSWSFISTGTSSTFYDILFIDMNTGFAAGSSGTIVKTTNGGTTWSIRLTGSTTLNSISFPTASTGYAVGGSPSSFYKSTDGGNTWTSIVPPSTNALRDVAFFTNTNGWVCGYSGTIMETTDGGTSWIPQFQSTNYNFERIYFNSVLNGYVIGSGGVILKTVNGGTNWSLSTSNLTTNLYGLSFADVNNGWVSGASGKIIHTTDGGSSWFPQANPSSTSTYNSINMTSLLLGYIVGSNGILLKTTDGGGQPPIFQRITGDPISNYSGYSLGAYPCDYDNDGYIDLLVLSYNDGCWSCNYPVYLFHNNGDGTFTRVTTGALANLNIKAFCACWGDYDNDGKPDLFISRGFNEGNLLFHNDGNGNFTQVTTGPIGTDAGDSRGCAWIDYDRDGWLDLFVCNQSNQSNFLYHNNGNGTFTKVTTGSIVTDVGWSRGCAWGDYDNDGWPDLYVCNYNNLNPFMYHNNGNGTFTRVYNAATSTPRNGTTCAWGDYNNDGWLDLAVTNTNQTNQLFVNQGNGNFALSNTIVNNDYSYIGNPAWEDFNNDGYLDLIIPTTSVNLLYQNINGSNFIHNTIEPPANDNGNSASWFDANNDGKIDLYVTKNGSNNSYFKNVGATGNYITFKLHGCMPLSGYSNTTGIGARIKIYYGNNIQIREVGSNGTNNMLWQHFGLGSVNVLDSVIVNWPSGLKQKLTNVNVNQTMLIDECLVGIQNNSNEIPKTYYLAQNYPNPFNPSTKIKYQLPKTSSVKIEVFDDQGKLVSTLIDGEQKEGYYEVEFNGENLSSGIYFYRITTGNFVVSKKMILIK